MMEQFITGVGQRLLVHDRKDDCEQGCVIHKPTGHSMVLFPTLWREDRGLMERICPHGIGHPDPDDIAFKRRTKGETHAHNEGIHGCDGCCYEPQD